MPALQALQVSDAILIFLSVSSFISYGEIISTIIILFYVLCLSIRKCICYIISFHLKVSAALVGFGTAAEVDAAVNIIRSQSHRLTSVTATHEKVPILSICSQLCVSMTVDNSSCRAFSFDPTAKVCKLSTQPSIGTNDPTASKVFDVTGMGIN